jgi:hypothetical protein
MAPRRPSAAMAGLELENGRGEVGRIAASCGCELYWLGGGAYC